MMAATPAYTARTDSPNKSVIARVNSPSATEWLAFTRGITRFAIPVPNLATNAVNPSATTAVIPMFQYCTEPLAMSLTRASTIRPRTSSTTAAARMIFAAFVSNSPRAASTCAVIPTLVATIAAPVKTLSRSGSPQSIMMPNPIPKGTITPPAAPDPHQLQPLHLEPHAKEEEHDAEVSQDCEDFVRPHPTKDVRANQYSRQDFPDDAWLPQPLEDLGQQFRGGDNDEHRERDLNRTLRLGGH